MTVNVTRTRRTAWDVAWGASGSQYDFGGVDKVTPDLNLVLAPIQVGTVGGAVLGHRIIGLEGTVTIEAREIDRTLLEEMLPWHNSGDSISLLPGGFHADLYDYAQLLTLHPKDAGADLKQDINLIKAVPLWRPMEADGNSENKLIVRFLFYPDRTQLGTTLAYGYVGPVPAE